MAEREGLPAAMPMCAARKECFACEARPCVRTRCCAGVLFPTPETPTPQPGNTGLGSWRRGWDCLRPCRFALRGRNALLAKLAPAFEPGAAQGFSSQPLKRQHPNPEIPGWGVGGGGGIRTHGTFRLSSFQDWRNRPLYHPSVGMNCVETDSGMQRGSRRFKSNQQA